MNRLQNSDNSNSIMGTIKKIPVARLILLGFFIAAFFWFTTPVAAGVANVGMYITAGLAALGGVITLFFPVFKKMVGAVWKRTWGKITLIAISLITALLLVTFITISFSMINAVNTFPNENSGTVIVLGAKVNGEYPSLMLANRLKVAAAYLKEHPDVPCIVTGGKGDDEMVTESSVMKKYLIDLGIEPHRIYEENKAATTFENMKLAKEIIDQQGFSTHVVIATDEFHQYRAQFFARQAGLDPTAQSSQTPPYLLSSYWMREIGAVLKAYVLGY